MNIELVAQMFKNYQSNVLFHLEGKVNATLSSDTCIGIILLTLVDFSY